jgi:hypothetical protein
MTAHTKVGGAFKEVSAISAKVGGSWKEVTDGWTKVGGAWKQFFASGIDSYGTSISFSPAASPTRGTLVTQLAIDEDFNMYFTVEEADRNLYGLVKMDKDANLVWFRNIDDVASFINVCLAVKAGLVAIQVAEDEIALYNYNGDFLRGINTGSDYEVNSIDLGADQSIYVTGLYEVGNFLNVAKLDVNGNYVWSRRTRVGSTSDPATNSYGIKVDDANSRVFVNGVLPESAQDHLAMLQFATDGTLITRAKSNSVIMPNTMALSLNDVVIHRQETSSLYFVSKTGVWDVSGSVIGTYDGACLTNDNSNFIYYVAPSSSSSSRPVKILKLDATNPRTVVWSREIQMSPQRATIGDRIKVVSNGQDIALVLGTPDKSQSGRANIFVIKADGSTTGSVSLNGITYSLVTASGSISNTSSLSPNSASYTTSSTIAPAGTVGEFPQTAWLNQTIAKDIF